MDIYRRPETLGPATGERTDVHVHRLYGVVQDEQSGRVLGLVGSWINCGNKTLTCALRSEKEIPLTLRRKWDQQVSTTLAYLHEAGVIWGDANTENVLVDTDDNAWIVDGGESTKDWVGRDRMETIEGDQEGLSRIEGLLYQE